MSEFQSNPAGRLYLFFHSIYPYNETFGAIQVVCEPVGMKWDSEWNTVMRLGSELYDNWVEVGETLRADGSPAAEAALEHLGQSGDVLRRFPSLASMTGRDFMSGLDSAGVQALRFAWTQLDLGHREKVLTTEKVTDLLGQVDSLLGEFDDLEVDDPEFLAEVRFHLESVRKALLRLDYTGSRGVVRSAAGLAGTLIQHPYTTTKLLHSNWLRRVGVLLLAVQSLVGFAADAKALLGNHGNQSIQEAVEVQVRITDYLYTPQQLQLAASPQPAEGSETGAGQVPAD